MSLFAKDPLIALRVVFAFVLFVEVIAADYDPPLSGAAFAQRALTWDLSLDKSFSAWFGTHNSYNYRSTASSVFEDPRNQNRTITEQLNLGARYIEVDPHTIQLRASDRSSTKTLVCHTDANVAAIIRRQCQDQWIRCEILGIFNYGDDTGCNPVATALQDSVLEINTWLQSNPNELMLLYLDAEMTPTIENIIVSVLSRKQIFARSDFNGTWPTPRSLISNGITTILMANSASDIAFKKFPNVFSANSLNNVSCPVNVSWARVQGDATIIRAGTNVHYNGSKEVGFVRQSDIRHYQNCGLAVLIDQFDESYLSSALWSWQSDPPIYTNERICAVLLSSGSWMAAPCNNSYYTACRHPTTSQWMISNDKTTATGSENCPAGSKRSTPVLASENIDLVQIMKSNGIDFLWISIWSEKEGCWARSDGAGPVCDRIRNVKPNDIYTSQAGMRSTGYFIFVVFLLSIMTI